MRRPLQAAVMGGVACGALVLIGACGSSSTQPLRYVALGDSFSSGEGVPPFNAGTNRYLPPRDTCHRSYRAYPALVADRRSSPGMWGFWACSGANVHDMTNVNQENRGEIAQLDRIAPPGSSDPGVDLVTVTIGGNDAQFKDVSLACVASRIVSILGSCRTNWRAAVAASIDRLRATLPPLYRAIRARAPSARIIVLAYPNPFPKVLPQLSRCRSWVAPADLRWLSRTAAALNEVIRSAAHSSRAGVTYLSPSGFDGHDVCSPEPWFNGLGLLPSHLRYSVHPNAFGQRRLAEIVLAAL
jgi:lysophospholipase L1-like esterase